MSCRSNWLERRSGRSGAANPSGRFWWQRPLRRRTANDISLKQSASQHSEVGRVVKSPDTLPCTTPLDKVVIRRRIRCSEDAGPGAQVASEYAPPLDCSFRVLTSRWRHQIAAMSLGRYPTELRATSCPLCRYDRAGVLLTPRLTVPACRGPSPSRGTRLRSSGRFRMRSYSPRWRHLVGSARARHGLG